MKVGYVLAGGARDGLRRYASMLERAVREAGGAETFAVEAASPDVLDRLSAADVVHLQWNVRLGCAEPVRGLVRALSADGTPPVVCTLHDVYLEDPWYRVRPPRRIGRRFAAWWRARRRARHRRRAFARVLAGVDLALTCFEAERGRLRGLAHWDRVRVVPHFVEERPALPAREEARRALGLEGRWIVVLGHIHPRKGYDLAIEALAHLPPDVRLAFVGEASGSNARKLRRWLARARELGLEGRVRVTGWVEEREQERWLAAADVGLCPFRFLSASGSLATWISAARPCVVTPLEQVGELRALEPEAFTVSDSFEPAAIAAALLEALERGGGEDPAMRRLARRLSLGRVARLHLERYGEVVRRRASAAR